MPTLTERIERSWYQPSPLIFILLPLSGLFWLLSLIIRAFGLIKAKRYNFSVPVVVVGNITVGGSGKTPIVIALVEYFQSKGKKVGVVSRGYGGQPHQLPLVLNKKTAVADCGDEPLMIYYRTGATVAVDPVRARAVEKVAELGCDVVISDDGLQHYGMPRDIELAVVDGERGFGNGLLLPAGPLREPSMRLRSVDGIILNGDPDTSTFGDQDEIPENNKTVSDLVVTGICSLNKAENYPLFGTSTLAQIKAEVGGVFFAVAGIGHPQRFFDTVQRLGFEVVSKSFPDHHEYSLADFDDRQGLPIIMTEKDAVKCVDLGLSSAWVLQVSAQIPDSFLSWLEQRLS